MGGCTGYLIQELLVEFSLSPTRSITRGFPEAEMYLEGIWLRMGLLWPWENVFLHRLCFVWNVRMERKMLKSFNLNAMLGRRPTTLLVLLSS